MTKWEEKSEEEQEMADDKKPYSIKVHLKNPFRGIYGQSGTLRFTAQGIYTTRSYSVPLIRG